MSLNKLNDIKSNKCKFVKLKKDKQLCLNTDLDYGQFF